MGVPKHIQVAQRVAGKPPYRWLLRMARDAALLAAYFRKAGRLDRAIRWQVLAHQFRITALKHRPC